MRQLSQVPPRILMLVPHEPDIDPRIRWVADLCAAIGPTEIIGIAQWSENDGTQGKPAREYVGGRYIERITVQEYASHPARFLARAGRFLLSVGSIRRYEQRQMDDGASSVQDEAAVGWFRRLDCRIRGVVRLLAGWSVYNLIIDALYRRARAVSIVPRVIVCHDLPALAAGIRLKKQLNCAVIYDAHEYWPEADLLAGQWERNATVWIERRLIRQADTIVTVSPPLAALLERQYGLSGVISAPNAEPSDGQNGAREVTPVSSPIKCLFQGRAERRRGLDELLEAWKGVDGLEAVLYLRCPENEFLDDLKRRYQELVTQRRLIFLQPVKEEELVSAARFADIGIIPYTGPNLNHEFCCPNKLSQYMQAGQAILANRLTFVREVIERYQCGMVYDAHKAETLVRAVRHLAEHRDILVDMKRRAREGAVKEFNWAVQSADYRMAIARAFRAGERNSLAGAGRRAPAEQL